MNIKNSKGFTLTEILASIVIFSILSALVFSILLSSKNSHAKQIESNEQLTEITYAMKLITKDIRRTNELLYDPITQPNYYKFKNSSNGNEFIYEYFPSATTPTLKRGGVIIAENIFDFKMEKSGNVVEITAKNKNGHIVPTTLYFREGK